MNRATKITAVVILLLAIGYIAVPKLLSTDYVRQRVTGQLTEITGLPVTLRGGSSITLRPYLSVQYDNVTIGAVDNPVVKMDRLRARLGLFSALIGDAQLSEVEMVRPIFKLTVSRTGEANWSSQDGKLAQQLRTPEGAILPPVKFGQVSIQNGIMEIDNRQNRWSQKFTSINGAVNWEDTASAMSARLDAVWRGENVGVAFTLDDPLPAMRGKESNFAASVQSPPVNLKFNGSTQEFGQRAVGALEGSSPSIERFLSWVGSPLAVAALLGKTSISGQVDMSADTLDFAEVMLTVGEHNGTGRLQLKRENDGVFDVSGTMAFETIGIPDFSFRQANENYSEAPFDLSTLNGFNLDVRLSSPIARSENFEAANVAASIIIRDGAANIDVGQAEAFEGTVAGSVVLKNEPNKASFSSRFLFSGIELSDLSRFYGQKIIFPVGQGNASFQFSSQGESVSEMVQHLNGEGKITGLNGTLNGIDLPQIIANVESSDEKIWQSLEGETAYNKLNLGFFIANGTAFLRGSKLESDVIDVTLGGGTDLAERSLALRGEITSPDGATLPFFVGGTTTSPLFVPLRDVAKPAPESAAEDKRQPTDQNQ